MSTSADSAPADPAAGSPASYPAPPEAPPGDEAPAESPRARPGPLRPEAGRHLPRRLAQLYAGLALYGASSALLVEAGLAWSPGTCCTRDWPG